MNLSNPEANPAPQIELNFWRDWSSSLWIVRKSIAERPRLSLAMLVLWILNAAVTAIWPKLPLPLGLLEQVLFAFIMYRSIRTEYILLFPEVEQNPDLLPRDVETSIFGAMLCFSVCTALMTVLLILPGIWFATASSLAVVLVAIDKVDFFDSLGKSQALVKGHFWQAFRYVIAGPFLMLIIPFGLFYGLGHFADAIFDPNTAKLMKVASPLLDNALTFFFQLSMAPLLVRLYAKLKIERGDLLIHQRNRPDPKFLPKWER